MDLGRILGAVLSGAATRPARRTARRGSGPFGMTQTQTRQVGRLVGTLATIAAEALSRREEAPAPPPVPSQRRRRAEPPAQVEIAAPRAPAARLPETGPRPSPAEPTAEASVALLLLRAMIAAARADGELDRAERSAIATQLDSAGLTAPERDHVLADFDRPATVEELARQARDPMLAAQLYAAACAVTSAGAGQINPAERAWLDRLGTALKLDQRARAAIEARLAA